MQDCGDGVKMSVAMRLPIAEPLEWRLTSAKVKMKDGIYKYCKNAGGGNLLIVTDNPNAETTMTC